jgi:hypothetical protein
VSGTSIKLTRKLEATVGGVSLYADNDPTLNIALATEGQGSKGITPAANSVNTTAGALSSEPQVETATAAGTINADSDIQVVVTAAGLPGSPKTIVVPVLSGDTAANWAGKVRDALNTDADVSKLYAATVSGTSIKLTRKLEATVGGVSLYADNDPTLNIALATEGQGSKGITPASQSANTTSGGFVSVAQVETATAVGTITADSTVQVVVTAAGLPGSPKAIDVPVLANDSASVWAGKVRTELLKPVYGITALFDVAVSGSSITLTRKESSVGSGIYAANDATLNIALGSSSKGITPALISVNTVVGDANSSKSQVETATAAGTIVANGNAEVVVTAAGMQGSPKTFSVPVSAGDSPSTWANKVRTALAADSAVSALFQVGGSGSQIVLTRRSLSTLDMQRTAIGDPLARALPSTMSGDLAGYTLAGEQPINIFNYSNLSDTRYIHTVGTLAGTGPLAGSSVLSTYQITNTNPTLISRGAPGSQIASGVLVGTVNPTDGSALIEDKEGAPIIWLHTGSGRNGGSTSNGYSIIPNSAQAKALYVTNTQAVIWENAGAAKNVNGSIPAPIVKHYSRNETTGALLDSPIYLDGSVLLNTPRSTPDANSWLITTAEKPNDAIVTLRAYALRDGSNIDTDGDGLVDAVENNSGTYASKLSTGTDPYDADTDDDGVNDGDEVYALEITDSALGWAAAKAAAEARGGWLATIADNDEHKALVRKIGSRSFSSYWLGAADTEATQVETATASGNITGNGTANATITASGLTGGNKSFSIPVIAADTPTAWAAKVRAALVADSAVAGLFNVSGSGDKIVLARKTRVTNDGTLNLALSNGTSTGITDALTSANTRASAARAARTFRWTDFTSFDSTLATSLFRPGEPNGIASLNALSLRNDFKWTDDPATEARSYVVEYPWSDPTSTDTDGDGLADNEERTLKGDPNNPDTDSDGLTDSEEKTAGTSLILVDTDGDSLTDFAELKTHKTNPLLKDTDGDGLEDGDEISLGTNPKVTDTDKDGLLDGDEVKRGTNPKSKDTDSDGLTDDKEVLVHKTNPLKTDSDGDLISDFDEVAKGSNPNNKNDPKNIDTDKDGLTNFDELFVHNTNPNKADTDGDGINDNVEITNGGDPLDAESDTDGDGLKDKVETRTKFFLSATNTGTDPYDSDSDNDGLSDKVETGTGKFVSMSNTGTNPNTPDTDGDGLDDKEETTGIRKTNHIAPVFTSSPFLIDTDGDLVGDFDESNARPKTNPRDPSKYPTIGGIKPISSLHALPVPLGDAQQVKINESFAPFGHRPDRDKVGDDGSGTIIDRNGVLIWTNKNGLAVTIPGSSLAKTLYVSNSECVVYKNRFAASYNSRSEKAEVVIYRREASGQAFSSKTIIIDGTVLDTCPVTPTTYGFTLVTGLASEDGAESEREQERLVGNPPVKAIEVEKADFWDTLAIRLQRITWDGELKLLSTRNIAVQNNTQNLSNIIIQATGSDGSVVFKLPVGQNFYAKVGEQFFTESESYWASFEPGSERLEWLERDVAQSYRDANVAFLSNERALIERENNTGGYELIDWRQGANNSIVISGKFALSVGDRVLPVSNYSINGLPIYVHTTNSAKTKLNLYRADSEMTLLGSQNLTAKIKEPVSFVKNPRDASLLIKGEKGGLIWIPTTTNGTTKAVTGLAAPRTIPNSAQGKPLFVTSKECVAWLNSDAPPLNGSLPPASISHFQIGTNGLIPANITPPMEGNYVVFPTALSPDPDLEGWYLSTFEKDAPASTLMRTYQLQLAGDTDRDRDGISDYDELTGRFSNANPKVATDPMDPDTDDDGLSDGRELMPFVFVSSPLSWESARIAAINQGGKLAVLNSANKQVRFQTAMKAAKATGKFWIGGHDRLKEGEFRWITNDGQATSGGSLVQSYVNWQDQQPGNFNDADAMEVSSAADFKWAMAPVSRMQGYVIEYPFSDPNKADGSGDADGDGLADSDEVNVHKTNPNIADTDNDGLSDLTEAGVLFSNPLTGFLSGAPVTLAKASYEGLLYNEKSGLLGKISVNMAANGTFTGTYEIYSGFKSSIKGTLNKNNGLLVANSFAANPAIGATTIALQKDSQTGRNHLHVRVNNPTFGLLYAKARPAATGFKPVRNRFTLEAPLSEEASGPTGTMVATGSIAANGGTTSLQMYNPDGTTASSSGRVLDGGVIALYAKSSGSTPTHVMANIKVNNVLNTKSNFDAQLRLLRNEYDQARTLEGSFYTAPAPRTLPISSFNASNTANNAVFNWTGGELDKAYQVNSWRPAEISPPKTNYDKTVATFTTATGLLKLDYTRSDKARNLYQVKSTAYAVANQRKNTVNGFYSRLNWEGGSFSATPNSLKLTVPPIEPPDAPIVVPGSVSSISPASKSVGTGAATYNIKVTGVNNWKVSIDESPSWVNAEVVNDDKSQWADKLTGRDYATVKITLLANNDIEARTATINIGDKVHTLTQSAGQVSSITPSSKQAVAKENTYSIRVIATGTWRAVVPTPAWIKAEVVNDNGFVPSGAGAVTGGDAVATSNLVGQGNATINVTISPNATAGIRKGSILIGDKVHSISQRPVFLPGSVTSINPTSKDVTAIASTYSIRVTGKDNWRVALNGVSWLQAEVINDDGYVAAGNLTGSGNATIKVNVAANSTTTRRTGTIKVGDKVHTVVQAPIIESGSVSSISPTVKEVGKEGATYNIRVTGTKNWSISIPSGSSWLSAKVVNDNGFVYAAAPNVTGSGNATVQVTVAGNATNRRRSASINIGGKTHTCEQSYRSIR